MPQDFKEPKSEKDRMLEDQYFESLSSLIYPIRGVKVMLDYELAELYGYDTSNFNRQVKNNKDKFDESFMFQITREEWYEILRSKILTTNFEDKIDGVNAIMCKNCTRYSKTQNNENSILKCENYTSSLLKQKSLDSGIMMKNSASYFEDNNGGIKTIMCKNFTSYLMSDNNNLRSKTLTANLIKRKTPPYVFTEEGIYMLMTVLKGELATKQSIMLIKTFKRMKDIIVGNTNLLTTNEVLDLHTIVRSHDKRISNLENEFSILANSLNEKKVTNHYLILNGHKVDGDVAYQEIYSSAKHSLLIIDDYIDIKTLQLLKCCKSNIEITIFTDNKAQNSLTKEFFDDFVSDTHLKVSIKSNGGIFHDRYIVIDFGYKVAQLFHSGPSSKDIGNGVGTINRIAEIDAYKDLISRLISNGKEIFKDN